MKQYKAQNLVQFPQAYDAVWALRRRESLVMIIPHPAQGKNKENIESARSLSVVGRNYWWPVDLLRKKCEMIFDQDDVMACGCHDVSLMEYYLRLHDNGLSQWERSYMQHVIHQLRQFPSELMWSRETYPGGVGR